MSESAGNPTAARRTLGQRLRALRTGKNLTVSDAAAAVGISQPKLTKIERGQMVDPRRDVEGLLSLYGVEGEERDLLMAMAGEGNAREWWENHLKLAPKFRVYLGLESAATVVQAYHTHLVHGLLQTQDYARALFRSGGAPELMEHEVRQLVVARLRRQGVLTRSDPPPLTLWSVMDEAVLRRQVGGKAVMHAQLERLIEASARPNINLLVIPDSAGAHAGVTGPMSILQFDAGAKPVIYVESQVGNVFMEKDDDLRRCQQIMNHVLAIAPTPEQSRALMKQIAKEMKP